MGVRPSECDAVIIRDYYIKIAGFDRLTFMCCAAVLLQLSFLLQADDEVQSPSFECVSTSLMLLHAVPYFTITS